MQKVGQLFATSAGHAQEEEQVKGSGGGGPVEAVWWVKDVGTQWRVRGEAFVIGEDIDDVGEGGGRSGVRTVRSEVGRRMRRVDEGDGEGKGEGGEEEWSWGRELTAHFGNCSPGMRGMYSPHPFDPSLPKACVNIPQDPGATPHPERPPTANNQTQTTSSDKKSKTYTIQLRGRISELWLLGRRRWSSWILVIRRRRGGGFIRLWWRRGTGRVGVGLGRRGGCGGVRSCGREWGGIELEVGFFGSVDSRTSRV